MEITNLQPKKKKEYRNRNAFAPQWPFRCILLGTTGSGKTNILRNLLMKDFLDYDTLTVYAKELESDEYLDLMDLVEAAEEEHGQAMSYFTDSLDKFVPLEEYCKDNQNIIVFDDFAAEPGTQQQCVIECFIRGRHHNISTFYLTQALHAVPKKARLQASMVIIFKGANDDDKRELWKDYCSNLKWDEFDHIYHECTDEDHGFMVIDVKEPKLRIRKGFDQIYVHNKK